jgi:alanyl-tRNA synthetase
VGRRPEEVPADAPVLPGAFAFKLHDTYGFPIDLTIELTAEYGVRVDRDGFDAALAEQRERSRGGRKAELARHAELTALYESIVRASGDTAFLGYEATEAEGTVVAIVRDGVAYDELTGHGEAEVVLDRTPFYAEGGGQVGDRGELAEPGGGSPVFTVTDTQKPAGGLIVHRGTLRGRLRVGGAVTAVVDAERRARTMRNHTATHLLHRALRNVAGLSARQAGSLVAPDYLRFDYPFDRALTDDEKRRVEDEVRRVVREDRPVSVAHLSMADAIEAGADAFFDEKYGETVRAIRVRDYSFELCGGTHCRASGEIGGFVITGERSIGSGMRRIEALTGDGADTHLRERAQLLEAVVDRLGAPSPEAVLDRIAVLEAELREAKRRLRKGGAGVPKPADLAARAEDVAPGARLVAAAGPWESIDAVKSAAKEVRALLGSGVIALALDADEPQVFVTVSDDLVARGVAAGDLVRAAMASLEGKGGGRPEMAQGKGRRRDGLPDALASIRAALAAASPGG